MKRPYGLIREKYEEVYNVFWLFNEMCFLYGWFICHRPNRSHECRVPLCNRLKEWCSTPQFNCETYGSKATNLEFYPGSSLAKIAGSSMIHPTGPRSGPEPRCFLRSSARLELLSWSPKNCWSLVPKNPFFCGKSESFGVSISLLDWKTLNITSMDPQSSAICSPWKKRSTHFPMNCTGPSASWTSPASWGHPDQSAGPWWLDFGDRMIDK